MHTGVGTQGRHLLAITVTIAFCLMSAACSPFAIQFGGSGTTASVDKVEVVTSGETSPAYTAVVSGHFPDNCTELGRTTQRAVRSTIKVTMYTRQVSRDKYVPGLVPFEESVRLDVGGPNAGSYAVDVNGAVTSFTLAQDQ